MVLTKYIPEKYKYNQQDVEEAIRSITGNVKLEFAGREITIHKTLTAAQKTALKNAVTPLLTTIGDITQ